MHVNFKVRGVEELQAFLKELPRGGVRVALKAFTEYVIGNESHGLKHPDPYKYVARKAAYGQTFKSAAQRGYVMARIREGTITPGTPQRTGESTNAWQYVAVSDWNYRITNPTAGAYFTRDEKGQAAQPRLVGWRKVTQVILDNMTGGIRAATAALNAWVKSRGR